MINNVVFVIFVSMVIRVQKVQVWLITLLTNGIWKHYNSALLLTIIKSLRQVFFATNIDHLTDNRAGTSYNCNLLLLRGRRGHDRTVLQLPMQAVPITNKVVSSNPAQTRCTQYNIMW